MDPPVSSPLLTRGDGLVVRSARAEDAAEMVRVRHEAIFSRALSHYGQPAVDAWIAEVTQEGVERIISDPAACVLVAECDNELIGVAAGLPAKGELRALYVKPNGLGRVGQALLVVLEAEIFRCADAITCNAALNAVQFYKDNGFIDEGVTEIVDGSGASVSCVRMKKVR